MKQTLITPETVPADLAHLLAVKITDPALTKLERYVAAFLQNQMTFSALKKAFRKLFVAWNNRNLLCHCPTHKGYHCYGGRGITLFPAWRMVGKTKSFKACPETRFAFCRFALFLGEAPSPDMTVERLNTDGNYEPGNVAWASRNHQANNKKNSWKIQGIPAKEFAELHGVNYSTLRRRLKRMPLEKALQK